MWDKQQQNNPQSGIQLEKKPKTQPYSEKKNIRERRQLGHTSIQNHGKNLIKQLIVNSDLSN